MLQDFPSIMYGGCLSATDVYIGAFILEGIPNLAEVVMLWSQPIGWTSRRHPGTHGGKMRSFLPPVAEQVFRDIQKTYEETTQSKTTVEKEM